MRRYTHRKTKRKNKPTATFPIDSQTGASPNWVDVELAACRLGDQRLRTRLHTLLTQMSIHFGRSIPLACQDWANTKAAYRFFDNASVDDTAILSGHFQTTALRTRATRGYLLVLHDTTEFSYRREKSAALGVLHRAIIGKGWDGRRVERTIRGIRLHSSLVVTPEGLPLGIAAARLWARKEFTGCNARKKTLNPTRVPIEQKESYRWLLNLQEATQRVGQPDRCVHIGDRESDIYELFCAARDCGSHFLVRTNADRVASTPERTVAEHIANAPVRGRHRLLLRDPNGDCEQVSLEIRYERVELWPSEAKKARYPRLAVTVISASENAPQGTRTPIEWKLFTDLPVNNLQEAIEKLEWYAQRWKIETFHKILKSGCRTEESKLRTNERLFNFIAVCCLLSWRVFWLTMLRRTVPDATPDTALTAEETALLDRMEKPRSRKPRTLSDYVLQIAKLGGYLARNNDGPPGNIVIWRGLYRLTDILLGFQLGTGSYG